MPRSRRRFHRRGPDVALLPEHASAHFLATRSTVGGRMSSATAEVVKSSMEHTVAEDGGWRLRTDTSLHHAEGNRETSSTRHQVAKEILHLRQWPVRREGLVRWRRVAGGVVLWILVVVMSVDCKLEEHEEPLLAYLIDSGEISRETAGLLQTKCMQEFLLAKRTINYFNPNAQSSTTSMHEAFSILCPQVKKVLLDCLRENILVSEQKDSDSDSDSWYNRYSGWFIFQRHFSSTRRELVQKEESAPFPTVAAVLVIAAFALAIGALLFFFCSNTSGQGINDENPLLRLSLSDHSIASTQKMPSLGALMSEEKYGNKSFNSRLSLNRSSSRSLLTDLHSPTNSKLEIPLGPTNGPLPPPPGNELPPELIQTLLKMAPTAEEELKLRLFDGDLSRLVPAERFLKVMVELPFAFKRLECLLFMCTLENEAATLKESFAILEAACTEVRKSRLFLKLLEAVLKTGNRMNDGTFRGRAQAFKLDTLLKLSDVRGIDGKTTLLHFVVQEIIRSEGVRAARAAREMRSMSSFKSEDLMDDINHPQESDDYLRSVGLQIVSSLGNELQNVKRAAILDLDGLTCTVAKMGRALVNVGNFLSSDMKEADEDDGFCEALRCFVQDAEGEVKWLVDEEKRITALMKSTADYFHGNAAGKEEGHRLFLIVRDFLVILDKVCKEVKNMTMVGKEQSPKAAPNQKKAVQVEAGRMMSNGDSQ
ncbi:Formin-like protein 5 [Striga hermonthica]|uniref:Formin-like protein n=1 Tax=Striga hermonthica TaxID=68872 RepID=A0A9N7MR36_STRHE|nr:Formin-like protein 5 [Striga hermonthica]